MIGGRGLRGLGKEDIQKMLFELEFATRGDADVNKAKKGLDALTDKMFRFTKQSRIGRGVLRQLNITTLPQFQAALAASAAGAAALTAAMAATAYTVTSFTKSVIEAGAKTEKWTLQFETLTGSAAAAQGEMDYLIQFAAKTPFELPQIVEAGVLMRAYSLDIRQYLGILGDTAAGMGKTLDQAVNALADASTGELERLKEFGITSAMITREMGHKINRETAEGIQELVDTVISIWERRYGGGMEKLALTWEGQVSMIKDKIFQFKNKIAEAGIFDVLKEDLVWVVDKLDELFETGQVDAWAESISGALEDIHDRFIRLAIAVGPFWKVMQYEAKAAIWLLDTFSKTEMSYEDQLALDQVKRRRELEETRKAHRQTMKEMWEGEWDWLDAHMKVTEEGGQRWLQYGNIFYESFEQQRRTLEETNPLWQAYVQLEKEGTDAADAAAGAIKSQADAADKKAKKIKALTEKIEALNEAERETAGMATPGGLPIDVFMEGAPGYPGGGGEGAAQYERIMQERRDAQLQAAQERVEGEISAEEMLLYKKEQIWAVEAAIRQENADVEQALLERKFMAYEEGWAEMFAGGRIVYKGLTAFGEAYYKGIAKHSTSFFLGEMKMRKVLDLATKRALKEGLAGMLDMIAGQAKTKADFYAAEALGLAALGQFGAAAKAGAAAAAFGLLAGVAAGGAAAAREQAAREEEEALQRQEDYGLEGYEGTRVGGGRLRTTTAARPMNLTIVTNLNFIGGLNWFGEEGERDLAAMLIPYIQEAVENGQIVMRG